MGRRERDLAETSFRIRLAVPVWLFLLLGGTMLNRTGALDRGTYLFLAWIAGPVIALLAATGLSWLLGVLARGALGSLIAQGGDPVRPTHSEQDALIAAGREPEAIDSFRARLAAFPDDVEARIRLAGLLSHHGAPEESRRQFTAARARRTTTSERLRICTGLADLHRAAGRDGPLRDELARCAREFAGTAAGEHARRELRALVAADADGLHGQAAPSDDAG